MLKRLALGAAALVAAFAAVTWWALEAGGVALVETRAPGGEPRSTHVWWAEVDGEIWLEAGTPENAWFVDVLHEPALVLEIQGRRARYAARPVAEPGGHQRIRARLREKYGLRDRWVGLLVDTSRSIAVRLVPRTEASAH